MAEEIRSEYPCSQKDLYSILETAWLNYDEHQADFAALKALYTVLYSTNAKAAVAAAKALPDAQARGEHAESLRVVLVEQAETCRQNFHKLKSYIVTAYPNKQLHKGKFEAAGQLYYEGASSDDWESVSQLNQSGSNFIAANTADLTAGNNMPAGFQATYDGDAATFLTTYNDFKTAEQTSEQTAEKINANNAVYRTGMGMMKDGQLIFAAEPDVAVKYQFQTLWDLVNPAVAGIKGNVKNFADNLPLGGAKIIAQQAGDPIDEALTDDTGNYSLRLAAGTYRVTVELPGFVPENGEVTVDERGYKTMDFSLRAV
jgi:hypothetical protein